MTYGHLMTTTNTCRVNLPNGTTAERTSPVVFTHAAVITYTDEPTRPFVRVWHKDEAAAHRAARKFRSFIDGTVVVLPVEVA